MNKARTFATLAMTLLTVPAFAGPAVSPSGVEISGTEDQIKAYVDAHALNASKLTLHGQATSRKVQADRAEVTVVIRTQSSRLSLALSAADKIEARIAEYAKDDLKLPETAIFRQGFLHYANEKANKSDNPAEVIKKVRLTFAAADQLTRFAGFLEKSKDTAQIEEIATYYAGEEALKAEVVAAAFADLKARKALYETQLGAKLRLVEALPYQLTALNDANNPLINPAVVEEKGSSLFSSSEATYSRNRYANAAGLEYGFGEIAFRCSVPAVFKLVE
ncbi:MAG: SIMPL domain-containing protein [Verrucomicrobiota bacterium]|nr:SIMPL domain-containing protein [Verrucomicrobiota bacterium]